MLDHLIEAHQVGLSYYEDISLMAGSSSSVGKLESASLEKEEDLFEFSWMSYGDPKLSPHSVMCKRSSFLRSIYYRLPILDAREVWSLLIKEGYQ
jgi:hypothetical protein